jgi:hypothetical protein
MAKFNNLLEQIKSQRVKAVVGVLQAAKSKSINRWKEMVFKKNLRFEKYKMLRIASELKIFFTTVFSVF